MISKNNFVRFVGAGLLGLIAFYNPPNKNEDKEKFLLTNTSPKEQYLEKIIQTSLLNNWGVKEPFSVYSWSDLAKYDAWVELTLSKSAKDSSNSIIINKTKNMLYLIKNGKVNSEYYVDLGKNAFDDKRKAGDLCTPEGMYKVKDKLDSKKFYKTLLIDYPNEEDKAKRKTGRDIEIHGHGGKGYNWTDGCVAMKDENLDEIFSLIEVDNSITIVKYTSRDLSIR